MRGIGHVQEPVFRLNQGRIGKTPLAGIYLLNRDFNGPGGPFVGRQIQLESIAPVADVIA